MNSNLNINVNPEELEEKANVILEQYKIIDDALAQIKDAQNGLSSWKSSHKDKYDAKINASLPKMYEIADAIKSYGNVAMATSRAIINTENIISKNIESMND